MSLPISIRIITKTQVQQLVTLLEVVDAVEETFCALGNHKVHHPVKEPMWLEQDKSNMLLAMPAFLEAKNIAGMKWVNLFEKQQPGYPSSYGNLLILNHRENGQPYAMLEATAITTMRTAGGHAVVAAKYLARKDSKTLAVIGCGEEGKAGIRSFLAVFPGLQQVNLFDINPDHMADVQNEHKNRADFLICSSAKEAVAEADIVLMATTARKPLVSFDWLAKGCFVAGMYSFHDLDPSCATRADKWVLGSKATDHGQIIKDPRLDSYQLFMEDVYGDLGEIVCGAIPGRETSDEIIVYTHMGMGALDVAIGDLIYRRAVEKDIGQVIRMD